MYERVYNKPMQESVAYTLKRSRRAKYMRLTVHPGGRVVLTAPDRFGLAAIERFVASHGAWLTRAIERMRPLKALPSGKREYNARRGAARAFVHERLVHWNTIYNFSYNRVAIKNTRSLWGSCSHRGNLNFSYKIIFLPRELADYIVVHELCHLKEPNHGPRFWHLVQKAQPEYLRLRRELRRYVLR